MKTPFFSFIVPSCNVEPYIEECIQSILNQSFRNWECIFGIETSDDRTEEIIQTMTAGDPRFRSFSGARTGSCSVTRNKGIDLSRGEYIIFLDGDDSIADDCLGRLHEKICANPGADLYPCAVIRNNEISGKKGILEDNYGADAPAEMTGVEATVYLYRHSRGVFTPTQKLQNNIHRREFLVKHNIKNLPGIRCQDCEFSPRELYLAKRVVPLHEPYYLYRIRPNSVQALAIGKNAFCFMQDTAVITRSLLAFYDKVSREEDFDERIPPCWIWQWLNRMNARWFIAESIKEIPREMRVKWLKFIFEDGFDAYDRLMKYGSFIQKILAFHVRMFVKYPHMRWYVETFFLSVISIRRAAARAFGARQ